MREADIDIRLMDYYLSDLAVIKKAVEDADIIELPPPKKDEREEKPAADKS